MKEEEAPKTKKPGRGMIKQMQEALEKAKLEQERLRQEEEAKQRALEEAENKRLEKVCLRFLSRPYENQIVLSIYSYQSLRARASAGISEKGDCSGKFFR